MKPVYFVTPAPGCLFNRYYVGTLDAHGVFHLRARQVSCPDGTRIDPPARIAIDLPEVVIDEQPAQRREFNPPAETRKRCPHCDRHLPRADFSALASGRLQSWCRKCNNNYRRVKRKEPA